MFPLITLLIGKVAASKIRSASSLPALLGTGTIFYLSAIIGGKKIFLMIS